MIRQRRYVETGKVPPELNVLVQTNSKKTPTPLPLKLAENEIVWLKWSQSSIVAKAKILTWFSGIAKNVEEIRVHTKGTDLFNIDDYWKDLASNKFDSGICHYIVIKMKDEEWLSHPIYPKTRSFGSSWIYLDSKSKRQEWLSI